MAPISKEAESVVTASATTPANPAAKSPAEAPTRPQPVALEIPVTIYGAHTVAGSDKREPFSESTQTVLVFSHGAVVRVAAALAPGQLVFLTNEKTKKEVVCQVLKSKSGGSANNNYVELQFTEAAPAFWGLRPATPSAVTAPVRPVSPTSSVPAVPPKSVTPIAPAPKPVPVVAKPDSPAAIAPPLAPKPLVTPAAPEARPAATQPVAPVIPAPLISVPPPSPFAVIPEPPAPVHVAPPALVVPPEASRSPEPPSASTVSAVPTSPAGDNKPVPAIPPPPVHDYSKEIDALFSLPSSSPSRPAPVPAAPEPKVAPPSSGPSSEQLKLEAARLQAQLSSLLFTETPATHGVPAPPAAAKLETSAPDTAKKVLEIAHEPKAASPVSEPKIAPLPVVAAPPPVRKSASPALSAEDEVRIPSWLAPLSYSSEPAVAEAPTSVPVEPAAEISILPESSPEIYSVETSAHSEATVFAGQLPDESSAESSEAASGGSKKGLWIGLAAAVLVLAAGATWYLRPSLFGSPAVVSAKPASHPAVASPVAVSAPAADNKPSAPPATNVNSVAAPVVASVAASQPSKNPEPVVSAATSAPASSAKNANPAPRVAAEPAKKPAVAVHLAAPVVNRSKASPQTGEALPSIETQVANTGGDALAVIHHNQPAAPLPIGGEVTAAQLVKSVAPIYPQLAKTQRISGNVQLDALVDASGNVAEVKVISGPPLLHHAALDAVKQWKYKPAILDGQPTSMHLTVTVQFRTQ